MEKKIDRQLLAYIKFENSEDVFIDVIEVSKKGSSYHYLNTAWNRSLPTLGSENCTNPHGNKCKISPLNRNYTPSWASEFNVIIKEAARKRYEAWLSKSLKRNRDEYN